MTNSENDTTFQNRRTGRPRNADRLVVPWEEVDQLLVFGEKVRDEETGHETIRYPSYRELGRRYGVSGSLIARYSSQRRCMERREENRVRQQIRFEQKVIEKCTEARAISAAEAVAIVDDYIRRFREALDDGRVRADGASDFNTMMRLKAFLEGKADSRQEVHGMITLEDMQARHRALRAQLEALDPAVTGEVPPRERDRTRGLLADDVDGSSDDAAALAPKRASEKSRVRRLPAEPLEPGDMAGIPVATRRRADDGHEPAPRRRVAPHDREDDFPDDELAEEREDARRDDVRALRRRTREDDHDDDELRDARVPRRARAVKPADVRALRRRTRAELEDGRVPRRARATEPERATTRRLRRASREERASFPDVVYSGRPGRGWEDEPEQTEPGLRKPGRGWR